jgi:tetratricopeptide (TPR) repeat protein
VDGLPLAIELVAARMASSSLGEIASNLDRTLSLLTTSGPGGPPRHRTMRAAIAWSHALLDGSERALFRRLSVFVGTFELAAAEEVGADPHGEAPRRPADVMPALFGLVDKSMVAAVSGFAGRARYRLLETVREYAAEQLAESGEAEGARSRHAAWCRQLVESVMDPTRAPRHLWPGRLDEEIGNLRAALEWCLHEGDSAEHAISIAAPLWEYFWLRGAVDEGRALLLRCLDAVDPSPTLARGIALRAAAHLIRHGGDTAEARRLGELCLANFRALDDPNWVPAALNGLGMTAHAEGDYDGALAYLREGLGGLERAERAPPGARALFLSYIGSALRCLDRCDEAREMLVMAFEAAREVGDRLIEAVAMDNLGILARQAGDLELGRGWGRQSLAVYASMGLSDGQLDALETLASIDAADGHMFEALRVLTVAERERRRLRGAVPSLDRRRQREAALAVVLAALDEEEQAAALEAARLTPLDELVLNFTGAQDAPTTLS